MNSFSEVSNNGDKTESDSIIALESRKTKRVLYFSDGIMEELSESEGDDLEPDATDKCSNPGIIVSTGVLLVYPFYCNLFIKGRRSVTFPIEMSVSRYWSSLHFWHRLFG